MISINLADKIDSLIISKKPKTESELLTILSQFNCNISIQKVYYFGYIQGVKILISEKNKRYVRPKRNLVYSIFK